jgi:hypothetical protein
MVNIARILFYVNFETSRFAADDSETSLGIAFQTSDREWDAYCKEAEKEAARSFYSIPHHFESPQTMPDNIGAQTACDNNRQSRRQRIS